MYIKCQTQYRFISKSHMLKKKNENHTKRTPNAFKFPSHSTVYRGCMFNVGLKHLIHFRHKRFILMHTIIKSKLLLECLFISIKDEQKSV